MKNLAVSYPKNVLFEFFPEIKISKPRSNTCKICDIYQIQLKNGSLSEEARRKLELVYLHHHKQAAEGYKLTKKLTGQWFIIVLFTYELLDNLQ